MGMASGVFEADLQRAKLRQQAANDAASHALKWRQQQLEERQYEDKRKAQEREEALEKERYERRQKLYEQELQAKGDREDRKLDYEMRRQDRLDALAERKYALQEAEQQAKYEKQRAVYDGYAQLGKQAKQQQLERQESGASALASVMKLAMSNGGTNPKTGKTSKGMIPRYGLEALNRDMGFDGQNQGFVSGGFTANGDFFLQYAQKDPQTGQMVTTPQVITPVDQFKIMNRQRGIFTNQDLGEMAAQLKQSGYRDDEIMFASGVNQSQLEQIKNAEKQVKAQKAAGNSDLKSTLDAIKMLSEYRENNKDMLKEDEVNGLNDAIKNMMTDVTQTINQSYLQKQQAQQMQAAKDAGKPVYDAQKNTLTMPDGTMLQKNQEWTDPETGNKLVWCGDSAKNFQIYDNKINGFRAITEADWKKSDNTAAQSNGGKSQGENDPQVTSDGYITGTLWKNGVKYQGDALLNEMKKDPKVAQFVKDTGGFGAEGDMYYEGPIATLEGRNKYRTEYELERRRDGAQYASKELYEQNEGKNYETTKDGDMYDKEAWNREYVYLLNSGKLADDVTYEDFENLKMQGMNFVGENMSKAPIEILQKQLDVDLGRDTEPIERDTGPIEIDGHEFPREKKILEGIQSSVKKVKNKQISKAWEKYYYKNRDMVDKDIANAGYNSGFYDTKWVEPEVEELPEGVTGISAKNAPNWPPSPDTEMGKKYYQATKAEQEKFWNDVADVDSLYNKFVNNGAIDKNKVGLADFANLMGYSEDEKADMHKPKLEARRPETDEESEEVYEYPDEMADYFKKLQEEEEMNEQAEHVKDWEFDM